MNRLIYSNWRPPGKARLAGRGIPDWNRSNAKERTRKWTTKRKWNDEEEEEGCIAITLAKNRSRAKSSYPGWKKFDREIWSWNCNRQRDKAWLLFENHICIEAEYGHNYIRNGSIILVKYILAPCRCRLSWSDDIEVTDFHRLII